MSEKQRPSIGERISQRLEARKDRRLRLGPSPMFYTRLGLAEPGSATNTMDGDGFTYVSGAPFYEMMRRLARARLRRQTRLSRYERVASRRKVSAVRRQWPEKRSHLSFMFGAHALAERDLVLPEPDTPVQEDAQEESRARIVSGWTGRVKEPGRSSAWLTSRPTLPTVTTSRPLRSAPERPMDRLTRRAVTSRVAQDPIVRAISSSGRPLPRRLVRVIESVSELPAADQIRIVRRTVRQMGGTARLVRERLEQQVPDKQVSPVTVAAGRMSTRRAQRRGLRPVMSRSPMMKAIAPPAPSAPVIDSARSQRPPRVSQVSAARAARVSQSSSPVGARTSRRTPRTRTNSPPQARGRRSGADPGSDGLPSPSAPSSPQPTAHLAHRARSFGSEASRHRSVLPIVAPRVLPIDLPPEDEPPVGAVRAARRSQIGMARPGSVLPRVVASDAEYDIAPSPLRLASDVPVRGATRRMAVAHQAPGQQVITPALPRAESASTEVPRTRTSPWKSSTPAPAAAHRERVERSVTGGVRSVSVAERPLQRATRRRPVRRDDRSMVPRPVPAPFSQTSSAGALPRRAVSQVGAGHRALSRQHSAEPAVRSLLPRLTRRPLEDVFHAADSDAVVRSGAGHRALARERSVEPLDGSTLPRLTREQSESLTSTRWLQQGPEPSAAAPRSGGGTRQTGLLSPVVVLPESAQPDKASASSPAQPRRSAWGPSPGSRTPAQADKSRLPRQLGVSRTSRDASLAPLSPVRRALARQDAAAPRAGSLLPQAIGSTRVRLRAKLRRMQASAPSAIELRPPSLAAPQGDAPAQPRRSPWGPSPGRMQASARVVSASSSAPALRDAARRVAVRANSRRAGQAPVLRAAERASLTPLVGYSANRAGTPRPSAATVDVMTRRSAPSPVSYVRSSGSRQVIYVQLPESVPASEKVSSAPAQISSPGAWPAPAAGRRPSIFDVGPSTLSAQRRPAVAAEAPVRRLARQPQGAITDRPLDRVSVRGRQDEGAPPPTRRSPWAEGHALPGARATARPTLWTGPDGVVIQASAEAAPEGVAVESSGPQRSAWFSGAPRAEASAPGVPAPWSRPVWSRGGSPRASSQLRMAGVPRAGRSASGVYVSQRMMSSGAGKHRASLAQDFRYPSALAERPPLSWTLEAVDSRSANKALPGWAQRASEQPRIGGSDDFLRQLARTREVSEVVRVIFERSGEAPPVMRQMSSPVLQVIQQIRSEAHRSSEPAQSSQKTVTATASGGGPRKAMRRGGAQPKMQQIARGMTGLRTMASAPSSAGVGEDKVSKLARRLRELIHLAEVKNRRDEARQGVRMAEDSASALAEGQSAPTQPDGGPGDQQVDIDALSREVMSLVQREMELQKERRIDGGDSGDIWW